MSIPNFSRQSLVSVHCADSDIEKTYPAVQMAMNACKETTMREMVSIQGLGHFDLRENGFNLIAGCIGSNRFCTSVLGLPLTDEWLEEFNKDMCNQEVLDYINSVE